ncbi:MAG: hypothetical protein U0936_02760 [Planctomycetaceae bacterium]
MLLSNANRLPITADDSARDAGSGEPFAELTDRLLKISRLKQSESGAIPALMVIDWWLTSRQDRMAGNAFGADPTAERSGP